MLYKKNQTSAGDINKNEKKLIFDFQDAQSEQEDDQGVSKIKNLRNLNIKKLKEKRNKDQKQDDQKSGPMPITKRINNFFGDKLNPQLDSSCLFKSEDSMVLSKNKQQKSEVSIGSLNTSTANLQNISNKQNKTSNSIIFHIQSDSDQQQDNRYHVISPIKIKKQENNDQQISIAINQIIPQQCSEQTCNILKISESTAALSAQVSQKLAQFQSCKNLKLIMSVPIPESVVFQFQVHRYKTTMKTQYRFLIRHSNTMSQWAKAVSNVRFGYTFYELKVSPKDNQKKQFQSIGCIISDFKRNVFNTYKYKQNEKTIDSILCTSIIVDNLVNPLVKGHDLYLPHLNGKQFERIPVDESVKNLKKMYKTEQNSQKIQKLVTHGVPKATLKYQEQQNLIRTNTTRNAILKDHKNKSIFMMLKVQGDRFKIRCGSGITPTQLFSYAIVHME